MSDPIAKYVLEHIVPTDQDEKKETLDYISRLEAQLKEEDRMTGNNIFA